MRENVLMKKSDIFWQTYLNLEKEVIEVSRYVFFTDEILVSSKGKCFLSPQKENMSA